MQLPFQLPIIDIGPYLDPTQSSSQERAVVSTALHDACVEYGFFYLDISKYVDPSEPEELTRLAREFFFLPQEEKDIISIANQDNARGKFKLKLHESVGLRNVLEYRISEIKRKRHEWQGRQPRGNRLLQASRESG